MKRNGGSQWGYLAYQRHQCLPGPDLLAGKTEHDIAWISPSFRPVLGQGLEVRGGSKTNVPWRRNCPYHHILALFPEIAHNEQLIILWLWRPQHTRENKLPSILWISSSHRAQVITPCSTSLQQILSVTDRATLLFSVEGIFKLFCFFALFESFLGLGRYAR